MRNGIKAGNGQIHAGSSDRIFRELYGSSCQDSTLVIEVCNTQSYESLANLQANCSVTLFSTIAHTLIDFKFTIKFRRYCDNGVVGLFNKQIERQDVEDHTLCQQNLHLDLLRIKPLNEQSDLL